MLPSPPATFSPPSDLRAPIALAAPLPAAPPRPRGGSLAHVAFTIRRLIRATTGLKFSLPHLPGRPLVTTPSSAATRFDRGSSREFPALGQQPPCRFSNLVISEFDDRSTNSRAGVPKLHDSVHHETNGRWCVLSWLLHLPKCITSHYYSYNYYPTHDIQSLGNPLSFHSMR